VPQSFKLYWCDEETEFVLKKKPETKDNQIRTFGMEVASVQKAVEELRREYRFFREPTSNEVALRTSCPDSDALRIGMTFEHCKPESWQGAMWLAEKAINLAGWLHFKQSGDLNPQLVALSNEALDKASMEAIRKAQDILKKYPELVPVIEKTALVWSSETKAKWVEVFGYPAPVPQHWTLWPDSLLSRSDLKQ